MIELHLEHSKPSVITRVAVTWTVTALSGWRNCMYTSSKRHTFRYGEECNRNDCITMCTSHSVVRVPNGQIKTPKRQHSPQWRNNTGPVMQRQQDCPPLFIPFLHHFPTRHDRPLAATAVQVRHSITFFSSYFSLTPSPVWWITPIKE